MDDTFRHKRPVDKTPSQFITNALVKYQPPKCFPILDLACGYGRHALHLNNLGYDVVCADFDYDVFRDRWFQSLNDMYPIIFDATKPIPFKDNIFGGVIVVHFYYPGLFLNLKKIIVLKGLIFYESIGGQGANWMELGKEQQVKNELVDEFSFLIYKEKVVGPNKQHATLKMIAKKVPSEY